jgi:hypothetical protein
MDGLNFQVASQPVLSDPARADIACFVGFVACRLSTSALRLRLERILRELGWTGDALPIAERVIPANVRASGDAANAFPGWLQRMGWTPQPSAVAASELFRRAAGGLFGDSLVEWWVEHGWLAPASGRSAADLLELSDVPVPVDTWDAFDALFGWDRRPLDGSGRHADTPIGAAVRRFFLHGGRKCYVVRIGDAWSPLTRRADRLAARGRVLAAVPPPTPVDRSTWLGVAHLFGLPDASFLCVPDLPDLYAADIGPLPPESGSEGEERFIECAARVSPETSDSRRAFPGPRCDEGGFVEWAALVGQIGALLQRHPPCREVQFIAAVPLPVEASQLRAHPAVVATRPAQRASAIAGRVFASQAAQWNAVSTVQTAFVQLAYPWVRTPESLRLAGGLEPPDALLAGLLANNALTQGTWRSLAREPVLGITGLEPILSRAELERPLPYHGSIGQLRVPRVLRERVSIFAPSPTGFQLLSDVTTDDDEAYRPAGVNRLVSAIVRAARVAGEHAAFANNGGPLWRALASGLEDLLLGLWGEGALGGATASEAFEVRCDRSTMAQSDLDGGRAIVRVQFTAAKPIERITVVLAMDEGGHVTLVPSPEAATAVPVS